MCASAIWSRLQKLGNHRLALTVILLLVGAGLFALRLSSVEAPQNCATSIPADVDIKNAMAIGATFEPERWEMIYADHMDEGNMSMRWQNQEWAALGHLDYLRYNCGLTPDNINYYPFDISLGGYEQWQRTNQCQVGSLHLHEFKAVSGGVDYRIRFWFKPVNDTRLAAFQLSFPARYQSELDTYSARLFPELGHCPQA